MSIYSKLDVLSFVYYIHSKLCLSLNMSYLDFICMCILHDTILGLYYISTLFEYIILLKIIFNKLLFISIIFLLLNTKQTITF